MNTRKRNSKETNNDVEFAKPILKNSSGFLYTKNVDDDMIESNI